MPFRRVPPRGNLGRVGPPRGGYSTTMREVTLVCRLSSRNGMAYYRKLDEELPKRGVRIVEAHMVRKRKELIKRIRQAVKAKAEIVVVIGGDGTQTAAVGELVHCKTILAVVPAGTGNSFAYTLGIQDDIERAIETIANGKVRKVDVGVVNGTYFANFATIGLIAEAANRTSRGLKKVAGPIAYGVAALVPLLREKPFELEVRWKGSDLQIRTHQAIVASGRDYGHTPLTPEADVRSGELAFFSAEGESAADVIAVNAALLRGDHTQIEGAHYFSARKITLRAKPRQALNVDGHALGKTPAKFSVEPKALRVLMPR